MDFPDEISREDFIVLVQECLLTGCYVYGLDYGDNEWRSCPAYIDVDRLLCADEVMMSLQGKFSVYQWRDKGWRRINSHGFPARRRR